MLTRSSSDITELSLYLHLLQSTGLGFLAGTVLPFLVTYNKPSLRAFCH